MNYKNILTKNITEEEALKIENKWIDSDFLNFLHQIGVDGKNKLVYSDSMLERMNYYYDFNIKKRFNTNIFLVPIPHYNKNKEFMRNCFVLNLVDEYNMSTFIDLASILQKNNIIIIPITYFFDNNPERGHHNLLILRKNINFLEHYDPHGKSEDSKIYPFLNKFYFKLKKILPKLVFHTSEKIHCDNMGFQSRQSYLIKINDKGGGNCTAWCYLFAESIINNSSMNSTDLILKITNIINSNNLEPRYLITGYSLVNQKNSIIFWRNYKNSNGSFSQINEYLRFYDYFLKKYY